MPVLVRKWAPRAAEGGGDGQRVRERMTRPFRVTFWCCASRLKGHGRMLGSGDRPGGCGWNMDPRPREGGPDADFCGCNRDPAVSRRNLDEDK